MSTNTSLVPIVSSQLALISNNEFVPAEWAHLIRSVRLEWYDLDVTPYHLGYSQYTRRCRVHINMDLDFDVVCIVEEKLRRGTVVKSSGITAIVQSMSINHSPYGLGPSLDITLEGWLD